MWLMVSKRALWTGGISNQTGRFGKPKFCRRAATRLRAGAEMVFSTNRQRHGKQSLKILLISGDAEIRAPHQRSAACAAGEVDVTVEPTADAGLAMVATNNFRRPAVRDSAGQRRRAVSNHLAHHPGAAAAGAGHRAGRGRALSGRGGVQRRAGLSGPRTTGRADAAPCDSLLHRAPAGTAGAGRGKGQLLRHF